MQAEGPRNHQEKREYKHVPVLILICLSHQLFLKECFLSLRCRPDLQCSPSHAGPSICGVVVLVYKLLIEGVVENL